jgi:hypothetical protein
LFAHCTPTREPPANTEVQAMGSTKEESGLVARPTGFVPIRVRPPRFVPEFEADIKRLYLRMMEEPVPARLLGILRAGLGDAKS